MNRVLVLASVASMIDQFNMPFISLLQKMGYSVDVACNFKEGSTCTYEVIDGLCKNLASMKVRCHQVDFARNFLKIRENYRSFKQVEILMIHNQYSFIHCHSPIGGVIGRLASHRTRTRVIYTAHGYHFYNGGPIKFWLLFYPVERFLARWTDVLITINREDYELAQRKLKARQVAYVQGVGVNLTRFVPANVDREKKRLELGIPKNSIWLLDVGELIPRKNHEALITAIANIPGVFLTIAGQGELREPLMALAEKCGVSDRVRLLGFRTDVSALNASADIFVFASFQEGLSVAVMEAMACGKPIVCSRIRGNTDLVDSRGGVLFDPHNVEECIGAIEKTIAGDWIEMGNYNREKVVEFGLPNVIIQMERLYGAKETESTRRRET